MNNTWQQFYDFNAPHYEEECFTTNTAAEIEFLIREMPLHPGMKVLDLGCGTGRHAVALAERGMTVTGLDISSGQLAEAGKKAAQAGVSVDFIQGDAANFELKDRFDAAICLCEGSFGLLSCDDDPLTHEVQILRHLAAVLRPGAPLLLTVRNALEMVRYYSDADIAAGTFDPYTLTRVVRLGEWYSGFDPNIEVKEKCFTAMEMRLLLASTGFAVDQFWGGTAGSWDRHTLSLDEIELMVKAHKR
ncbi:MAG: class I SAM-dependent methyltransferase [Victivallales bacterium]|nr:class I SAM-dependent methyltransferase [Victivallales bacterium]